MAMKEGWLGDDYFVLFEPSEGASASERYDIVSALPGYSLVGLRGWDEFIVRGPDGALFTVPTVPLDVQYLAAFRLPSKRPVLEPDPRFAGKIKWYLQPVIFGGDPEAAENTTWVTREEHAELVRYWNSQYRSARKSRPKRS